MHKNKSYSSNNFIRKIIDEDLANGKYTNIQTRFPPEPNGYLHIGHSKSICLNFGIANDYQGQCNLRFDDTNPIKENTEFVESIKYDIQWLGFNWNGKVCYSSDYFDKFYNYAVELIINNLAYVDELTHEEIREYRGTLKVPGKNSPYRNRKVKDNLLMFKKMRDGMFTEGKACLRAKINMASNFIILRDPVLYRIKFVQHHQTGNEWCIYPMYDFAHCISDALEGITHSLCTLEFQDNRRLYDWILSKITIPMRPCQYEFSRLNLEYMVMSKRKLLQLVNKKYVNGWDDPRMLTISGLRRRGYTPASIRKFCQDVGISKQDNIIKMTALESCIRDDLDKNAPRAMAVLDPVKIIIENLSDDYVENIIMYNHPKNLGMGTRTVPFTKEIWIDRSDFREESNKQYKRLMLGKEVRLRNSYVIYANRIEKNKDGIINCIYCTYDNNTLNKHPVDGRKIKGVIHWISVLHALPAEFRLYDRLFNVPNPGAIDDFISTINMNSLTIKYGFVESNLEYVESNAVYQFEREGYFCVDSVDSKVSKLVFNRTVSLRENRTKNI